MAIIGRIRNRVGLLIGIVGVSMVLFILGDIFSSNQGLFSGDSGVMGSVNGEKLDAMEYETRVQTMIKNYTDNNKGQAPDQNTQDMLRDQAWQQFVDEQTVKKEFQKLGIACSADELYELCTGPNANPQVKQAFTNPKTGQFDPNEVVKFLKDLPNREVAVQKQWSEFEKYLAESRIQEKYNNLVKGGIYVTTAEAKQDNTDKGRNANIRYIMLDYLEIADSSVKVDDAAMKAYYNEHQQEFKQKEDVRKLEYLVFDIIPSSKDRAEAAAWIAEKAEGMRTTTDAVSYLGQYGDAPFDSAFYAKGALRPAVDTALFNAEIGATVGPYEDMGSFKVSRLNAIKLVPDSVKARHILIKFEGADSAKALAKADSLKSLIKGGAKFADLATKNSEDIGSAIKGGDLGWFAKNAMVGPFDAACFNGNKGDMPVVISQFGVHLIEILDKGVPNRQIQVATLERKVEASEFTSDSIFAKANQFAGANTTAALFDSAVVKQGLNKRIADNVKETDRRLPGIEQPRELIRWAYGAKVGEVSKAFNAGEKYVVAKLTEVKEKGVLPMEAVKEQVKAGAIKAKKAEMLFDKATKMGSGATSIEDVAAKLQKTAQIATNVSFASNYNASLGNEQEILGKIFTAKAGTLSKPVKGNSGVFVFVVDAFNEPPALTDAKAARLQLEKAKAQRADYETGNAVKEKMEIVDNRGKYF